MTLNQIVAKLREIAEKHLQIKAFGFGDSWEFEASGAVNAPAMWAIPKGAVIEEKTITYNFSLLFMDLVDKGEENELEVLSDQTLIAMDVLSMLELEEDIIVIKQNNLEFFTERFDNEWAGVFIDLGIKVSYLRNNCEVPKD